MHTPEHVRRWLAVTLPERNVASVRKLGEGLDHVSWLVDDALVVRFAKAGPDAAEETRREAALLDLVCHVAPIPTPRVELACAEQGILVLGFLRGMSLLDRDVAPAPIVAKQLGELLTALHRVPREDVAEFVEVDDVPLEEWLGEARKQWSVVRETVTPGWVGKVETFLAAPPPARREGFAFCHNDLGSEHLLVGAGDELTGVLDWSDAALADPAVDFSRIYRDFGPDFMRAVRASYAPPRSERSTDGEAEERVAFYARCSVIEDLAFGHETNDERYRRAAMRSIPHLFGA